MSNHPMRHWPTSLPIFTKYTSSKVHQRHVCQAGGSLASTISPHMEEASRGQATLNTLRGILCHQRQINLNMACLLLTTRIVRFTANGSEKFDGLAHPSKMLQCVDNSAACWWLIVWIHSHNALQGSTHALYFAHNPA